MSRKIEKFSPRARIVFSFSQIVAEHYQQALIEPEHLLLGLYDERNGNAGQTLRALGLTRQMIVNVITLHLKPQPSDHMDLSEATKRVLQYSAAESSYMGSFQIGTGLLLLNVLRLKRPMIEQILLQANLTSKQVSDAARIRTLKQEIPFDEGGFTRPVMWDEVLPAALVRLLRLESSTSPFSGKSPSEIPPPDKRAHHRLLVEVLTEMRQHYPTDRNILQKLAMTQLALGEFAAVLDITEAPLKATQDANKLEWLSLRARALYSMRDYQRTIETATQSLVIQPENAMMLYLRGWSHHALGQRDPAVADLASALTLRNKLTGDSLDQRKQEVQDFLDGKDVPPSDITYDEKYT
jgi:tetratricopeptide (TPR) repeat protein